MHIGRLIGWITVLWLSWPIYSAHADEPSRAQAQAHFQQAERAAAEMRFEEAVEAYRKAEKSDPSAPFAATARVRADDLMQHAEGGFVPLKRLSEIRKIPPANLTPSHIVALEQDMEGFPPGRVRTEARLFIASAYRQYLNDRKGAIAAYERVLLDSGADKLSKSLALSSQVALFREAGELDAALHSTERFADLAPNLYQEALRQVRRARIYTGAMVWLGALLFTGVLCFVRALSRFPLQSLKQHIIRPLDLAFSFYVGGMGSILVRLHGGGDVRPFLGLGLGIAVLTILARIISLSLYTQRAWIRAFTALACALGVFALAFIVLEQANAGYLDGLGF